MDRAIIIQKFQDCMSAWNRKLFGMDAITGQGSLFSMNPNVNDINYYIGSLDSIGENYIRQLIEYGNNVIQQLRTITFPPYASRDEQNECMRNMRERVSEIPFPVHEDKRLKGVGREMVFLDFPLKSNVATYGPITSTNPVPPYQNWSANIPDIVIERINCYLDAFKSLIGYREEATNVVIEPDKTPIYKNNSTKGRGGKRKKKTHRKRSKKIKSKKR